MAEGLLVNRLVQSSGGGTTQGEFKVRFLDYDGTILSTEYADAGQSVVAPSNPDHTADGLTFVEWNNSYSNIQHDLDVGACFKTTDQKTHAHIKVNVDGPDAGYVEIQVSKDAGANTVWIDWGDTNTDSNISSTEPLFTHTYSASGDYVIKIWIDGHSDNYYLGTDSTSTNFIDDGNKLQKLFMGENAGFVMYGGYTQHRYCEEMTLSLEATSLPLYGLRNLTSLKAIIIPSNYTDISGLFYGAKGLERVSLPMALTAIGSYAFADCHSLESIVLPDDLVSIANDSFRSTYSLQEIIIPSGVDEIGYQAFSNSYMRKITFLNTTDNIILNHSVFENCYHLMEINIETGFLLNGDDIFQNCMALISNPPIAYESGYTTIFDDDFDRTRLPDSIDIPEGITLIETGTFYYSYSDVVDINLPSTLTAIQDLAFFLRLTNKITCLATTPPTLGSNGLYVNDTTEIYVPAASLSAYKAATNWAVFADQIYAIPE